MDSSQACACGNPCMRLPHPVADRQTSTSMLCMLQALCRGRLCSERTPASIVGIEDELNVWLSTYLLAPVSVRLGNLNDAGKTETLRLSQTCRFQLGQ